MRNRLLLATDVRGSLSFGIVLLPAEEEQQEEELFTSGQSRSRACACLRFLNFGRGALVSTSVVGRAGSGDFCDGRRGDC
ncbi:unnamed protein product [Calypogeia fissa]